MSQGWFLALVRQPTIPSGMISLIFHSVMIAMLVFLTPPPSSEKRGIGERTTGEIGIVYSDMSLNPGQDGDGNGDGTGDGGDGTGSSTGMMFAASIVEQLPNVSQIITERQKIVQPNETVIPKSSPSIIGFSSAPSLPGTTGDSLSGVGSGTGTGGGKGGGGRGGRQGVRGSFMGAEGVGSRFIYVLDRSESTGNTSTEGITPLTVAKRELMASLEGLLQLGKKEGKPIQFQIIFFNHETEMYTSDKLSVIDDQSLELAKKFIGEMIASGGTAAAGSALVTALQQQGDVIFFLTDGDKEMKGAELARVRQLSHGEQIHVIEYGIKGQQSVGSRSLKQLAQENHGNYLHVDIRDYYTRSP